MSTRSKKDDAEAKKVEGEDLVRATSEEDVEAHNMGMLNPTSAWELAKSRQQEIARESARHPLIAAAKIRARRKH